MTDRKTLHSVEIKDADKGQVTAVFSTLGVKDSDGDVTLKGAFTDGAPVVISAYGHKSWEGELPLGHGTIRETKNEAVLEGQFLMNTAHGRDAFETVKALSDAGLQEWSYSLENIKAHRGKHDGEDVRFIDAVEVKEVSPVLRGAGVNTRTLVAKSDQGRTFSEHGTSVLADVTEFTTRAAEVMAMRAAKGKGLSAESVDLLTALETNLSQLKELFEVTPASDPDAELRELAEREYLRFVASLHA